MIITAAKKLEPGGIYALETDVTLTANQRSMLKKEIQFIGEKLGVKLIILDKGIKISEVKELKHGQKT